MSKHVHRLYVMLLFALGIGTAVVAGINGWKYYTTSQDQINNTKADLDAKISDIDVELEMMKVDLGTMEKTEEELRAEKLRLREQVRYWDEWKPTGFYGHGLGIVGSALMIIGVSTYSSRKRIKRLRYVGKIKHWLEFHIFLCLLGPTLVLYHTTFKFGGIVSVSAWSMIFVALSGIFGRYIYTQIPHTADGADLSLDELEEQNQQLASDLQERFAVDAATIERINHISRVGSAGVHASIFKSVLSLLRDDLTRRSRMKSVRTHLLREGIPHDHVASIMHIAKEKSLLLRRMAFLNTARGIFHYWHVIHLPFTIIMFLILAIHVAVTVSLGYTWIF